MDKMEQMLPSPDDPIYMDLVRQGTDILLRDMPEVILVHEYQMVPMNSTYWTGWPSAKNPYIAPVAPWDSFNQIIWRLKPTQ